MDAVNTVPQKNRCERSDRKQGNFHQICGKNCVHSSEASTFASQILGTVDVAWSLGVQGAAVDGVFQCLVEGLGLPGCLGCLPVALLPLLLRLGFINFPDLADEVQM